MLIKSIFTNSSGILVSRVLGFIRDLLTASILGANVYSDIFFVAFKFPNLFRRIFAEGAFTQAFIPS
ncbi:MAG: lipid II flippase MurJ, partial [Sulfurovum sp.]